MPLISTQDRQALQERFRKDLKRKVTLRLFTQTTGQLVIPGRECPTCPQTRQILEELTSLSPMLELEAIDFFSQAQKARESGVERIPAIVMGKDGASSNVKYYGMPAGYEFVTLLEDVIALSQPRSTLSADTRKKLKLVDQDVHIQVLVTPT
ncbi:MAG: thioredoxin family protein [Chloroflexi bacterium]|nr:thioredoxin family protein [Chloroflexota bacterium]